MMIENRIDAIVNETVERYRNSIPQKAVLDMVEKIKEEVKMECAALNYGRKYYEEHKEERRAYQRKYYAEHREYYAKKNREFRRENRERINAERRERRRLEKERKEAKQWN